ncbi:hypothetical protein TREMEDRAFT_69156 [Tremella mesenterica DSM 1558]|uniref:uncharacterized protein n=1 Tax=Tremella mesenterica (strain ATCC 24925 / CBS 8224 / DSM 1558 / NBRC 9311 / NRRL Y-6157 / RJB 2259-6 / UBC 559-6) TaxID=578456 RepID=UPI0003F49F34|nr:uncharacterized protein TREMEDRAFT_69156 [Tremella mesenterica DSM 1558]EIW68704.1 hypothetical protein TREMEDRAFT_69156 [Tremella mesenterica DSM 1558]
MALTKWIVWGRMIEGVATLGGAGQENSELWLNRARTLVEQWEALHGRKGEPAGLHAGGMKIYQGWMAGLIAARAPLTAMSQYLVHPLLPLEELMGALKPSDLPVAYDSLEKLARRQGLRDLEDAVRQLQGLEKERREMQARAVVEEVRPVLESDGRGRRKGAEKQIVESGPTNVRFTVESLRKTLSAISSPSVPYNRQLDLERASLEGARAELAHSAQKMLEQRNTSITDAQMLQRERLQSWMHGWLGELTERLRQSIKVLATKDEGVTPHQRDVLPTSFKAAGMQNQYLLLYLTVLPPEKLALITILEVMRMSGSGGIVDGMKALRGIMAVGKAVETEYRAETIKSVGGVDSPLWLKTIDPQTQKPSRQLISQVWNQVGQSRHRPNKSTSQDLKDTGLEAVWTPAWSPLVHASLGGFLVDALLSTAKVVREATDPDTGEKIVEEQPAFAHEYEYLYGKKLGVIKLNPVVAARLARDSLHVVIHPRHLPMLVPPKPWTSQDDGGYLVHRVPVMRYKESAEQQIYLRKAFEAGHLEPVFHGLDVLSGTPWTINRKVFDVVLSAWNSGDAIADLPASQEKAQYDFPVPPDPDNSEPQDRTSYVVRIRSVLAQQRKDHAERCKFNYNLEIARSYLNDTFYLPHNMDFRGRAYPIPPHLSPVGDDLCRGLLQFGEKRTLGRAGLKWLQIHLANVYGYDKASFEERAQFAVDHEKEIFNSADNPLDGQRWWLQAEDPWQCLASCFDLAAALRSENPEAYESALPIHQDGTCNGMQHYAALGGDVNGARAVNLENGDRPADIYTGVADLVNKAIEADKKVGVPMAQFITEPLERKVVKQTVMTTVYGVTFVGAREQIAKQLSLRTDIPPGQLYQLSIYVAKAVLSSIGDLFVGAKHIMEFLTICARLISRSIPPSRVAEASIRLHKTDSKGRVRLYDRLPKELMTSVIWTTPLGLPVVQPYRKPTKKQVMTALQSVYISDPNAPAEVSPQKQASAFPPNFIHSLDATHMLLTAYKCKQNGITFASVHDSYWTHAASVEHMSELIRDTFIDLHSQDLIGNLREEFIERYGDHMIPVEKARKIDPSSIRRRKTGKTSGQEKGDKIVSGLSDEVIEEISSNSTINTSDEVIEEISSNSTIDTSDESLEEEHQEVELEEEMSDGPMSVGKSMVEVIEKGVGKGNKPELSEDDVRLLGVETKIEKINGQGFVRFRDIIPPTPEKGSFVVDRVRDSLYFFS